ncbi:MAG: hypothetical protein HY895_00350 [Deltaproteobacteria bacterium]|nr:hypothetical protein [Deltaproteobacteria bacterium]
MNSCVRIKLLAWLGIAGVHFGLSNLILPLTMALTSQAAGATDGPGLAVTLLVRATRLLHFPLVTLALFPREWFPGNWVYIPMAANSAIWACAVYCLIGLYRRLGRP